MKEIVTFFGGDSKVGTTMIAQSVAEELGAKERVLLIFASSEPYDNYLPDVQEFTIDYLRENENPKEEDVNKIIHKGEKFSYIRGCDLFLKVRHYSPDLLDRIEEHTRDNFDYYIIDGGHNYQYPLPINSLRVATKRFYVITGSARTVQRFDWLFQNILKAKKINAVGEKDEIIMNFHTKDVETYTPDMIRDLYQKPVNLVPKIQSGRLQEALHETLNKTNKQYREAILKIVRKIVQ